MEKINSALFELLLVWYQPQVGLPSVIRWNLFQNKPGEPIRPQSTLQHSFGFVTLLDYMMLRLQRLPEYRHYQINQNLLLRAAHFHDVPEGILNQDLSFMHKTSSDDAKECLAFFEYIKHLPDEIQEIWLQAYLLQFVAGNFSDLPMGYQDICHDLKKSYFLEANLFSVMEQIDYYFYALEQYLFLGNYQILLTIIEENCSIVAKKIHLVPGLAEVLWTPEIVAWNERFLAEHI